MTEMRKLYSQKLLERQLTQEEFGRLESNVHTTFMRKDISGADRCEAINDAVTDLLDYCLAHPEGLSIEQARRLLTYSNGRVPWRN